LTFWQTSISAKSAKIRPGFAHIEVIAIVRRARSVAFGSVAGHLRRQPGVFAPKMKAGTAFSTVGKIAEM
jgi:hypothetical protein